MSDIGPGDLVECIKEFQQNRQMEEARGTRYPIAGIIYTVRKVIPDNEQGAVLLEEIINPPQDHIEGFNEAIFCMSHFRPVRTTDISIFTEIAQDVKDGIRRKILEDA